MHSFAPHGYGSYPPAQFGPSNRIYRRPFTGEYGKQPAAFAPPYPAQPFYQPPFGAPGGYPINESGRVRRPGFGAQLASLVIGLDEQLRYEQYLRNEEKMRRQYLQQQASNLPANYNNATVHYLERETRYVPFPVYINPGAPAYNPTTTLGYGTEFNGSLPPKIRVIFIPNGQSSFQQPCMGPLTMPPFLFNRMSQPFCSFPLPPPLPQLASLPLTPAVQQMVMQRHENPVAVLPYCSNWQMPQPMMPAFPQMMQQQQQMQPMPVSALQSYPSAFQPYSYPTPAMPTGPPVPQPGYSGMASAQPYPTNNYQNICRACPPAPPPLNISVTGHCWVQHCSACHHVPTPVANPNARPGGGRVTPLLRHPIVPQYVPDQTMQTAQHAHANAPIMMRPWLRKTPPLPPGAVLLSDTYVTRDSSQRSYRQGRKHHRPSRSHGTSRSSTVAPVVVSKTVATDHKRSRSKSPTHRSNRNIASSIQEEPAKVKSDPSSPSTSGSSLKNAEYQKLTLYPTPFQPPPNIPPQLAAEARNVNLQYNYQSQELPSVYLINRFIKSSSEHSGSTTHVGPSPSSAPSISHESDRSSLSLDSQPVTRESLFVKEDERSARPLPSTTTPRERLIIIREFITKSPSTISTISSDAKFSIIDRDSDSMSTTSTLKESNLDDDERARKRIF